MHIRSKLPQSDASIFSTVSGLARAHNAINLGQGFPDFDCDENLKALVNKYLNNGKNQYSPMAGTVELRTAIAGKINHEYGLTPDSDTQICVTAGATQALYTAIQAFVHAGDEVIVIEPAYDSYIPAIHMAGGIPIPYRLTAPDYTIDWDKMATLISAKTRMLIINTPHNPTGSTLKPPDLQALQTLVEQKDIVVLSDEVYEHLIFDNQQHQSVLRYPQLFQQSIAVYSFGKTLHATGWKVGYCVGPEKLISAFKQVHQWTVFSVSSFVQYAIAEYILDPKTYTNLPTLFQEKRDYLTQGLSNTPLKALSSAGTYFQLYDYSAISDMDDMAFYKDLITKYGVASIPLSPFYSDPPKDKVLRLCFAKSAKTLGQAIDRLSILA